MKKENGVQIVNVHLFSKSKGKKSNSHLANCSKTIPQEKETKFSSFHSKLPSILNYENLLNKLLKFIKNTFPEPYLEIKNFLQNEIQLSIESSIKRNESQSSILNTIPQSKNISTIHPPNTINIKPKNEKKLKLSYDFSNLLTSPKPKPIKIEISNIKKVNNITITPSNTKTITKDNKDIHSLFTILKKDNQSNNNKAQKQKPSKTQSNSKSKSKSTSRECSNNHYTNTNSNLTSGNNLKKVTTVKQTLITKSQPLLNEKLFSKLNLKTNTTHSKSKVKKKSFIKVKSNSSNKRTSSKCSVKNHSSNMKTIPKNSKSKKKKQNKTTNQEGNVHSNKESKVKSQYIDLTDIPISNVNVTKNEEMMKQIKNTLDDNLKVMFNFSYENFLSKESESESKKSSQQDIVLSDQNE